MSEYRQEIIDNTVELTTQDWDSVELMSEPLDRVEAPRAQFKPLYEVCSRDDPTPRRGELLDAGGKPLP